jgi:hypothetical protein
LVNFIFKFNSNSLQEKPDENPIAQSKMAKYFVGIKPRIMKSIPVIIACMLVACSSVNNKVPDRSFQISSYSAKDAPSDSTMHKPGDAEVFRITGKDTTYITRMYRKEAGEVRRYESTLVGNFSYDRASFEWQNDSTISFKLIDSKDDKSQIIKITGSNAITTVQ